jgi:hypothetical protein
MKILLFDMDSVLLTPGGYHRALQETIRLIAVALGYSAQSATQEDIHQFEAAGVTSEWEASAMCACLLLKQAWAAGLEIDLPDGPPLPKTPPHDLPWVDLGAFLAQLSAANLEVKPLARSEQLIVEGVSDPRKAARLVELLRRSRRIDGSLTHRLFQEMALGSATFAETYGRPAYLGTQSYLTLYDTPNLSAATRRSLLAWLSEPDQAAVIFTNRPSTPPDGFFDTPEAEFGRSLVGLDSVPILGAGGLGWLSTRHGLDLGHFFKPSRVHALAALGMALRPDQEGALNMASSIERDEMPGELALLDGGQIYVFEDSVKGFQSAAGARDRLAEFGIHVELTLLGINPPGPKRERLVAFGVPVFDHLDDALAQVPGLNHPDRPELLA